LSGGEDFICDRKNLTVYVLLNFKSVYRFENWVDVTGFWSPDDSMSERILDVLKTVNLGVW